MGQSVLFLRSSGSTTPAHDLWRLDLLSGAETMLVSADSLLVTSDAIPAEERRRRERLRESGAGITAFSVDGTGTRIVFALAGQLCAVTAPTGQAPTVQALAELGPVVDPRISPDGHKIAWHAQGRLWIAGFDGADPTPLTPSDDAVWGLADFIAAEELDRHRGFWWSPESDRLLVTRVDDSAVDRWWISDPAFPSAPPAEHAYPAAGRTNASVSLWTVSPEHSPARLLAVGPGEDDEYLATVSWHRGPALALTFDRRQRRATVHAIHDSGPAVVAQWHDDAWVDVVAGMPRWTDDGELLTVRRDPAADRLRLYADEQPVSPADLQVRALLDSHTNRHAILVNPTGTTSQVATVSAAGTRVLTPAESLVTGAQGGGGWHTATVRGDTLVQSWAGLGDEQWHTDVLRVDEAGEWPRIAAIRSLAADSASTSAELLESEGLRIAIVRPSLPRHEPLPLLLLPYGGPHGQRVLAAGPVYAEAQWWADQGYFVVIADGRGTPGLSPSWERAVLDDLAAPVLADQISALDVALEHLGEVADADRVGISGWSFGGYLSALAVLRAPHRFHAAIAGAPVTDWHLYDTAYTERYLGRPQDNPDAYAASDLLPEPGSLVRPLMLIHGLADDNVVAAHTLRLSAALLAQGYPHQVLPLPGVTHMAAAPEIAANLLRVQRDFFDHHLHPQQT